MSDPKGHKYFAQLDGLRTVAILFVMVEHFGGELPKYFSAGYYGVDLFFVISGFLITSILMKSQGGFKTAYIRFTGRRTLRIFPLYYLTLAILYPVDFADVREDIFWLATYTWNYAAQWREGENWLFYLWSLSVEEQFYLFWPFVILTLRRWPKTVLAVTLVIVAVSYAQLLYNIFPSQRPYNYTGLINRMGSLGVGAAGAIAFIFGWLPKQLYASRLVELATLLVLGWALTATNGWRLPVLATCSLILVLKAVTGKFSLPLISRLLAHPKVTFIGRISYGIYVFHWPLGLALNEYVFDPIWLNINFDALGPLQKLRWHSWIIKLPLYFGIVTGAAALSFRYFESPLLALKDRWFPANAPLAEVAVDGATG